MKKIKMLIALITIICSVPMVGCDSKVKREVEKAFDDSKVTYQADTRFLYSLDGGVSWSQTIQEIPVNETYYLAIEMQVSQSETTKDEQKVVATITIPETDVLDCYLDDHPGVSITGKKDVVTNSVSYDFDIIAGISPSKFRVVFECKPISEGRAEVVVVYDDKVDAAWDCTGKIKYVETAETTSSDSEEGKNND